MFHCGWFISMLFIVTIYYNVNVSIVHLSYSEAANVENYGILLYTYKNIYVILRLIFDSSQRTSGGKSMNQKRNQLHT